VYADLPPLGNGAARSNNPLGNSTNAAMLPGLKIDATTNTGGDIVVLTPGFAGAALTNDAVFSNVFQGLNFSFGAGVNSASLEVLSLFDSSNVTITALDPSNNVLGTFTVNNAPNTGSREFIGFITSGGAEIGSLDIVTSSPGGITPGVDQVQFGNIDPTPKPSFFVLTGVAFTGCWPSRFATSRPVDRSRVASGTKGCPVRAG